MSCIAYKCKDIVYKRLHVFNRVILCFKLRGRTYTRYDVYMGIVIARLLRRKLYAWCNAYRKRLNAKVRNYDLRDMDNEMNKKTWNFIEINELSGWNLAPLRK